MIVGLGLEDVHQTDDPEKMKISFKDMFLTKTRDEWTYVFKDLDACFSPVLDSQEVALNLHNQENNTFLKNSSGTYEPGPAPKLSRTPGVSEVLPQPVIGQHTVSIMKQMGYGDSEIEQLLHCGAIEQSSKESKL